MSGSEGFKRAPAIRCWIKHLNESTYHQQEKTFYTIFGKVKRVRLIATILEKTEKLIENYDEDTISEGENLRLDFILDDGTGSIRGIIRNVNPKDYRNLEQGDIVDVVGRVSKFQDFISLWIEIIRKVDNPNYVLLRNSEIIKKIKNEEIQEIPSFDELQDLEEIIPNELDINSFFDANNKSKDNEEIKEKIFSLIEEYSLKGKSISFEILKEKVKVPEIDLRTYINDLIIESRIYKSDNNCYETY